MAGVTLCLFCLKSDSLRVLRTKKGRPWLHCFRCGARVFLGDDVQLAAYAVSCESVIARFGQAEERYIQNATAIAKGEAVVVNGQEIGAGVEAEEVVHAKSG